ncbi:hypothetical protein BV25DRAFT_1817863 [Artomyces pyxidatus]|uniref:Uncharacterized protein n=1 Tax=Artomyces pyxidatus TaxID=48021 RepID=A0ACB8TKK0_9AGAM|nr:hypothetical protein BV25DRAFT_1817863 [Artomyces pyxidatus]
MPVQPTSPRTARPAPTSPTRARKAGSIPGFRVPPKPKPVPIEKLTIRELRDLYDRNARILAQPAPSTSTYVPRLQAEQARIQSQLVELEGMEDIQHSLKHTKIKGEDDMAIDSSPELITSRAIEAKRKALSRAVGHMGHTDDGQANGFSFEEAVKLEQQAHALDLERKQRALEKRQRTGMPVDGEIMTREEREARIWAFMNYKPTESDLEDDDDESDDDDDPANWFEDDQDDGRKGQNIVEPDTEDLTEIIRVDTSRIGYSTFYEPQSEGD